MKIPAVVLVVILCFGVGIGVGVVVMPLVGYEHKPYAFEPDATPDSKGAAMGKGGMDMSKMGKGGDGKGGKGGMGKGGGGMPGFAGGGPNAKRDLAQLIGKLEQIASKPLTLNLNEKQRGELLEQLKGIDDIDKLDDREASEHLAAIVQIIRPEKDTLEAAGYTIPGAGMPGGGRGQGNYGERVKSLRDKLTAAKTN